MLNKFKYAVIFIFHFGILMGLFIRFIPWLTSSEPVSSTINYNLRNGIPPEWAQSFAINHGNAMYYKESIPSEEPILASIVVLSFIALFISGYFFNKKFKENENH